MLKRLKQEIIEKPSDSKNIHSNTLDVYLYQNNK